MLISTIYEEREIVIYLKIKKRQLQKWSIGLRMLKFDFMTCDIAVDSINRGLCADWNNYTKITIV